MPLNHDSADRRAPDLADANLMRFPMYDGPLLVPCVGTYRALIDIAVSRGDTTRPIAEMFDLYRTEVEAIASAKFDRGEFNIGGDVIVTNSD